MKKPSRHNPRQDIFTLNPKISLHDCYDEITKRIQQTLGVIYGGHEAIEADTVQPMQIYYCWAIRDMLEEALYFLEIMLAQATQQKLVS